ncbi:MAG: hypothetical protein C4334_00075 [Pyrinomonas sp.]|uniref:GspMb/PilO family protein n=1 Tax=Pyrinomonas sp. TaxID=2080306 RepID=UPI0033203DE3
MNEALSEKKQRNIGRALRTEQWRARLAQLRQKRRQSALDLPELLALVAAALLLTTALGAYFYLLVPTRSRLQEAQRERTRLQSQLRLSAEGAQRRADAQATANEIVQSLVEFETNYLAPPNIARNSLLQMLNELMRRNGLRLAEAMTFTPLAPLDPAARRPTNNAADERASIFPGLEINLTVEGPYVGLRRFIHDLETTRQFVVINGIELESSTEQRASADAVRLRLDLVAYFRREGAQMNVR